MAILINTLIIFLMISILLFLSYKFIFLRDPKRIIPKQGVVSPADGIILGVFDLDKHKALKNSFIGKISTKSIMALAENKGRYAIVIVMNLFDVHVQRAPLDGIVTQIKYKKGKFLNAVIGAKDLKATIENERNEITIKTKIGDIKVIQVAGILAKRIQCFARKNQKLIKGQRIGRIVLGSQVVLIIPKLPIKIKKGQHIKAGQTIIANLK